MHHGGFFAYIIGYIMLIAIWLPTWLLWPETPASRRLSVAFVVATIGLKLFSRWWPKDSK